METLQNKNRFREFIIRITDLVEEEAGNESVILDTGAKHLNRLVARDDWLPDFCARPDPDYYQQYLLYVDPQERFSIVSFVWGPGQRTPIHDHTVWGVIGMLRGAEQEQRYQSADGILVPTECTTLALGDVAMVSPAVGDVHQVSNVYEDRVSVSIHVYGADIGKVTRHIYFAETGEKKHFISGYADVCPPAYWD
jgi:predicted metal-dependent enzyme (double-stranded beta helix superfamily)